MSVPPPARITSRQHNVVRRFRALARRGDDDGVLLDGEHLLAEALDAGVPVELVLSDGRVPKLAGRARASGAAVYEGSAGVLDAASPVRTSTGVVALARWRLAAMDDVLGAADALVIGLCGVQDPGNVGSAIRSADALGATGVLVLDDSADPRGWKVLRGAMGSTFHLPVARGNTKDAIAAARRRGLRIAATVATGGRPADSTDLRPATLILVGSEGAGLSDEVAAGADARVTIPMRPRANSLNVAAVAALMLYEAGRQRSSAR